MRVALLHNESSGGEDHDEKDLVALLEKAGHQVIHVVDRVIELKAALHRAPCELVVAAGGDGTVGRAARELSGWQVPLAILPLGTANNTARALGVSTRLKRAVKGWSNARPMPFDLGLLDDGSERSRFAECVGWGVFTQTIVEARSLREALSVKKTLKRDRELFRAVLAKSEPRHYRVDVDGRDASGDYVLVEILNIPFIGPQLSLSPGSDPSDGQLELVLVSPNQRAALDDIAAAREPGSGYRVERGSRIRIETEDARLHRDSRVIWHPSGVHRFEIRVEPGAIHYLR